MQRKVLSLVSYLKYLFASGTRHSVHSPFVYTLINEVFKNRKLCPVLENIDNCRDSDINSWTKVRDAKIVEKPKIIRFKRTISPIIRYDISKKYGQLLFRLIEYFKPSTIIQSGVNSGFSSIYLTTANSNAKVFIWSGIGYESEAINTLLDKFQVSENVKYLNKINLDSSYFIHERGKVDFVFLGADEGGDQVYADFETFVKIAHNETVFVINAIHQSAGIEKVWSNITNHACVTVSIDIYGLGLVFLRKELSKQKFVLRF